MCLCQLEVIKVKGACGRLSRAVLIEETAVCVQRLRLETSLLPDLRDLVGGLQSACKIVRVARSVLIEDGHGPSGHAPFPENLGEAEKGLASILVRWVAAEEQVDVPFNLIPGVSLLVEGVRQQDRIGEIL